MIKYKYIKILNLFETVFIIYSELTLMVTKGKIFVTRSALTSRSVVS
jgi:hypothetical protein